MNLIQAIRLLLLRSTICIAAILLLSSFGGKKNAKRHFEKGNKKLLAKEYRAAIVEYNKAIRLKSNYAEAYYNRGVAKTWIKDIDGAMIDFKNAVKYNKVYYTKARKKDASAKYVYWSSNRSNKFIHLPIFSPNN